MHCSFPLIISSGGNSGSQGTSLIIKALALHELQLRDWGWMFGREIFTGLALGTLLGAIGFARIVIWQDFRWGDYGPPYLAASLVCRPCRLARASRTKPFSCRRSATACLVCRPWRHAPFVGPVGAPPRAP